MGLIGNFEKGKNLERTIEDLSLGETAYTHPTALALDTDCNVYLNTSFAVISKPEGEFHMPVKRIGPEKSDYDVDIRNVTYRWLRRANLGEQWCDSNRDDSKIVQLEYNKSQKFHHKTDRKDAYNNLREAIAQQQPERRESIKQCVKQILQDITDPLATQPDEVWQQ